MACGTTQPIRMNAIIIEHDLACVSDGISTPVCSVKQQPCARETAMACQGIERLQPSGQGLALLAMECHITVGLESEEWKEGTASPSCETTICELASQIDERLVDMSNKHTLAPQQIVTDKVCVPPPPLKAT